MEKLIIGSHAAKHWFPDFREPKDIDYISKENVMTREIQHFWVPSFQKILDINKDSTYIDADLLFALKVSHAGFNIFWEKTMADIVFLKQKGCKLNLPLYKALVKDWKEVHGKKWATLKGQTSKSFFEHAVVRKYNHDSVHEAIAVYEEPLYFKILKEPGGVACSEEKFDALSEKDKEIFEKIP